MSDKSFKAKLGKSITTRHRYLSFLSNPLINLFVLIILIKDMKMNQKFIKINKYQIDYTQLLGKGGMASVFLGYYAEGEGDPQTRFAVK